MVDHDYRIAYQRGYSAGLRRGREEPTVAWLIENIAGIKDEGRFESAWSLLGNVIRASAQARAKTPGERE